MESKNVVVVVIYLLKALIALISEVILLLNASLLKNVYIFGLENKTKEKLFLFLSVWCT